ncbi:MAG: hypothetical protein IKN65_00860 [Clostridia bacterium]|nr:hypothetical protein [Clostridia bacterium]
MKLKNKTYDFWKKVAQYYLPAIATFVITVFEIWGIPYGTQISGTIMALDTLLGVFLGISSYKYNKK